MCFYEGQNSQNGELVLMTTKPLIRKSNLCIIVAETAIINRELDGLYGYMILKGSEVVTENHKRETFFQLVTNSQKYYQIERFDRTRDIIISTEIQRQFLFEWLLRNVQLCIIGKILYAIRMENKDNRSLL